MSSSRISAFFERLTFERSSAARALKSSTVGWCKSPSVFRSFFRRMQITQIQKNVTLCRKLRCNIFDPLDKKSRFAVQFARFRIGINLTIDKDDARELNQRFCVVRSVVHLSTANNRVHIAATLYLSFLNLFLCFL